MQIEVHRSNIHWADCDRSCCCNQTKISSFCPADNVSASYCLVTASAECLQCKMLTHHETKWVSLWPAARGTPVVVLNIGCLKCAILLFQSLRPQRSNIHSGWLGNTCWLTQVVLALGWAGDHLGVVTVVRGKKRKWDLRRSNAITMTQRAALQKNTHATPHSERFEKSFEQADEEFFIWLLDYVWGYLWGCHFKASVDIQIPDLEDQSVCLHDTQENWITVLVRLWSNF